MSRYARSLIVTVAALSVLLITTSVVLADFIEFADDVITCSSASFSYTNTAGTSYGADFAQVTIYNTTTMEELYFDPEVSGPYDGAVDVTFPEQPAGSTIIVEVVVAQDIFGEISFTCAGDEASSDDGPLPWGPPCDNLFDGRINDSQALDCGAPVAIYYDAELDTIFIYGINPDTGDGQLAAAVPLASVPVDATANQTVISTVHPWFPSPLVFSRLSTGEWQLTTSYVTGKPYIVVWSTPEDLYHLAA